MAFVHGKNHVVLAKGRNLTSFLNAATVGQSKDTAETTAFGNSARTRIAGIQDGTLSLEGFFDGTATTGSDAIFEDMLGDGANVFGVFPNGDAVGNSGYACEAIQTSYETTGDVGDAVGVSIEAEGHGGIDRVISHETISTDITASGNGTTVDNSAATANGGAAYVQCVAEAGGTSLDVTLRHSTDNFAGDDTLLGTFAQLTGAGEAEKISLSGTIKQYVRAVYVEVGGGTWNINVGLNRL